MYNDSPPERRQMHRQPERYRHPRLRTSANTTTVDQHGHVRRCYGSQPGRGTYCVRRRTAPPRPPSYEQHRTTSVTVRSSANRRHRRHRCSCIRDHYRPVASAVISEVVQTVRFRARAPQTVADGDDGTRLSGTELGRRFGQLLARRCPPTPRL
jgi:hypothetical protein